MLFLKDFKVLNYSSISYVLRNKSHIVHNKTRTIAIVLILIINPVVLLIQNGVQ